MTHIVDFAFVHPGPHGAAAFGEAGVISVLLLGGYPRLPVRGRAGVAIVFGAFVTVQALFGHVLHVVSGTAKGADYSGVLYLAGGAVIFGLGITLAHRLRSDGATIGA